MASCAMPCATPLHISPDNVVPSRWASKMNNSSMAGWNGGWVPGAWLVPRDDWCSMTDLAQLEFFSVSCGVDARCDVNSMVFSLGGFPPVSQGPGPGPVPPKWIGRLRAAALTMANLGLRSPTDHPCLGSFVVSCHACAHHLVVIPRVFACPLMLAP